MLDNEVTFGMQAFTCTEVFFHLDIVAYGKELDTGCGVSEVPV